MEAHELAVRAQYRGLQAAERRAQRRLLRQRVAQHRQLQRLVAARERLALDGDRGPVVVGQRAQQLRRDATAGRRRRRSPARARAR